MHVRVNRITNHLQKSSRYYKKGYAKKILKNADNAATSKEELHNTKSETSFAKVAFFNAHSKGAKES